MKIPKDDPRAAYMSSNTMVNLDNMRRFVADKHHWVMSTTRADGRPQMSLVTGGMTPSGQLAVSTYPERVKAKNARRNPNVSIGVMGADFGSEWIQIDGTAQVLDMPEATEAFIEYYRCISGEHPNWDDYVQAMHDQGKCMIVIEPTRWSPVSKGGFPPSLFED
ncbi:MAG: PPOX class F420-dependent oxidoreductase [Actinobacteria bacterium]|jgi:PPOX class probable F420-dependent enzyme|nr:PPOX class F420-dependent oxidoreductase [Actinomycetota bacterium]